jgi:hypothetical protein
MPAIDWHSDCETGTYHVLAFAFSLSVVQKNTPALKMAYRLASAPVLTASGLK